MFKLVGATDDSACGVTREVGAVSPKGPYGEVVGLREGELGGTFTVGTT